MSPDRHRSCAWCGRGFTAPSRRGPAPRYCSPAHRQAAYRHRHPTSGAHPDQPPGVHDRVTQLQRRVDSLEQRVAELAASDRGRP